MIRSALAFAFLLTVSLAAVTPEEVVPPPSRLVEAAPLAAAPSPAACWFFECRTTGDWFTTLRECNQSCDGTCLRINGC